MITPQARLSASPTERNDFIMLPRAAFEEGIRELEAAQLTSVATKLKQAVVETASRSKESTRSQELDALVSDLSVRLVSASADLSSCQKTQSTDLPEQLVHTETALQSYTTQLAHAQETLKQLTAEVRVTRSAEMLEHTHTQLQLTAATAG